MLGAAAGQSTPPKGSPTAKNPTPLRPPWPLLPSALFFYSRCCTEPSLVLRGVSRTHRGNRQAQGSTRRHAIRLTTELHSGALVLGGFFPVAAALCMEFNHRAPEHQRNLIFLLYGRCRGLCPLEPHKSFVKNSLTARAPKPSFQHFACRLIRIGQYFSQIRAKHGPRGLILFAGSAD